MGNGARPRNGLGRIIAAVSLVAAMLSAAGASVQAADGAYPMLFPVAGSNTYTDTWGAPRSEDRLHRGADIFADKGTPVVAVADGVVTRVAVGKRAGRYIIIKHDDGWKSYYLHLDNDTPGTDDGLGGAPAAGIKVGVRVEAGDVIDFVGDSGNAEETPPHLHFELHQPDGTAINPTPHLRSAQTGEPIDAASVATAPAAAFVTYEAEGTEMVGHIDPGGGFGAGLAVNNGVAYMGTWGRPNACPNSGVRVIDVSDPAAPTVLTALAGAAEYPDTSTDGVWAGTVDTESFSGDIAVVSVRLCDTSERNRRSESFRGLAIYDVTDPAEPTLLSSVHSGENTQGVNDVTAVVRDDGSALISAAVMQSFVHTEYAVGDWRLIDASDPTAPVELADWDFRERFAEDDKERRNVNLHTHTSWLSADGSSVWLPVWDGGLVALDLTTPTEPVEIAHVPVPAGAEGNSHSVAFDPGSGMLIRNDEDLDWRPGEGSEEIAWGGQTLFDASDPGNIVEIGSYASPGSDLSDDKPAGAGYFSAHEIVLVGDIEYLSWYSDGLRVVDVSDPQQPQEVASFVPPPTPDPQRHFVGQGRGESFPMVWSVKVDNGLIYLSDMNSGLWIVRLEGGDELEAAAAQ